jgi:hypothetical protein
MEFGGIKKQEQRASSSHKDEKVEMKKRIESLCFNENLEVVIFEKKNDHEKNSYPTLFIAHFCLTKRAGTSPLLRSNEWIGGLVWI